MGFSGHAVNASLQARVPPSWRPTVPTSPFRPTCGVVYDVLNQGKRQDRLASRAGKRCVAPVSGPARVIIEPKADRYFHRCGDWTAAAVGGQEAPVLDSR